MEEQELSPDLLTPFFMKPCGCQIIVETTDWDWWKWKGKQGRKRGGRGKCWWRTLSMLLRPTSLVPRMVTAMQIHDDYVLHRLTEQGLWKEKGPCHFPGESLLEVTPSPESVNLRTQTGPVVIAYWSLSPSLILRSWDHSFLTWDPCVDLKSSRTSYNYMGICTLYSREWVPERSRTCQILGPSATWTLTRTFSTYKSSGF